MSTPQIPPGDQPWSGPHLTTVAGGPSIDEHLAGLDPELVERIRTAAAEIAATAPPLTQEQIKNLSAIFRSAAATKKTAA